MSYKFMAMKILEAHHDHDQGQWQTRVAFRVEPQISILQIIVRDFAVTWKSIHNGLLTEWVDLLYRKGD